MSWLLRGLDEGFPIGFDPARSNLQLVARNHPSSFCNREVIAQYIAHEVSLSHLFGPVALEGIHSSPNGLNPKAHQRGNWWMIVDLSCPTDSSVSQQCSWDYLQLGSWDSSHEVWPQGCLKNRPGPPIWSPQAGNHVGRGYVCGKMPHIWPTISAEDICDPPREKVSLGAKNNIWVYCTCYKHDNTGLFWEGFTHLRAFVAYLQSSKIKGPCTKTNYWRKMPLNDCIDFLPTSMSCKQDDFYKSSVCIFYCFAWLFLFPRT